MAKYLSFLLIHIIKPNKLCLHILDVFVCVYVVVVYMEANLQTCLWWFDNDDVTIIINVQTLFFPFLMHAY